MKVGARDIVAVYDGIGRRLKAVGRDRDKADP